MVWACFTAEYMSSLVVLERTGQGTAEYIETLTRGLFPFITKMSGSSDPETINVISSSDFIFMHDNAPCHKGASVTSFLATNKIPVMNWPAQSPDLNPIENLWKEFKRQFHEQYSRARTHISASKSAIQEYGEGLQLTWNTQGQELARKLVESMPRRVEAVIQAKGGPTRY